MPGLKTEKPWQLFVFGGIGSCVADIITLPIDVTKVRLQVQGRSAQMGSEKVVYEGAIDCVRTTIRTEGVQALFKGLKPALLRQATYGSARLGLYEPLKDVIRGNDAPGVFPLYKKILAGAGSGVIASGACNPADLIKIRMQADTGCRYSGLTDAFRSIVRDEGIRGGWKGAGPTMQRAGLVAAAELATYDQFKQFIIASGAKDGMPTHFAASLMAGFVATVVSSPADVIKARIMSQAFGPDGRGLAYSSSLDCIRQTVKQEGVASLWKGFVPNYARLGPHVMIMFVVVEQLRATFG